MYDVKALYGPHTLLLRAPTTAPSSSFLSSAPSPAEASRRRSEPLTSFTICARVSEAASKTAGERQSAMKEVRRAPNKYSMFLSKFSKVFSLKGFQAAAAEWRRFSAESKRREEVDALIATPGLAHKAAGIRVGAPPTEFTDMSSSSFSDHNYRQAIIDLYKKYDPAKVSRVDELLRRFSGHEEALVNVLERKFREGMASAGAQASTAHCADAAQARVTLEGSSYSGPSPNAPRTINISIKCDDSLPYVVAEQPVASPSDRDAATASENVDRYVYRTRLLRLYEAYAPLRVSQVDHELDNCKGREEAYLCAMEKELRGVQTAEGAEDATEETSLPATLSLVEAGPLDDHQRRTNNSAGYEVSKAGLLCSYETDAPDPANNAERQLQLYLGRDEEAIQEAVAEYGPVPVVSVVDTEATSPALAAGLKREYTATATANSTGPLKTPSPSAPLPIAATPQEAAKAAKHTLDGVAPPPSAAATLPTRAETAATPSTSQEAKVAAVVARITEHNGGAVDDAAAPTQAPRLNATALGLAMPPYSGDARHASSPPDRRAATPVVTRDKPAPVAAVEPLQAASARKADVRSSASRLSKAALPARKGESARTLVLARGEIDASLSSTMRRTALFDVVFYDFFRVLGSFHVHGCERVSLRVASVLLGALFQEASPAKVRWEHGDMSCVSEKNAGVSAEEMRELIVQGATRQLRSQVSVPNRRVAQFTHSLVRRMAKFVQTCRMAVVQLQRQPHPLSAGFWVHRSVLPRAVPHWKRCWATTSTDGDAISVCYAGSLKTELRIPFVRVARCYRERYAAGAPPVYARNGLAFQLTTGTPPLLVVVCPESCDVTTQLLSAFRSWSRSPRNVDEKSTATHVASSLAPAPDSQCDVAESSKHLESNQVRAWVLVRATSTYEPQRWCVEDLSIYMMSDRTRELHTCSVADVEGVVDEIELPVTPPTRRVHGFVICLGNGAAPLMAFTEQPQDRTRLLDRVYQSQALLQVEAKVTGKVNGGG
ncbi:hypothetical protein CGC21_29690 [Leishmania donovani]|uniref:Uncharacterized protein n=2 Tax=Leishmania donovani TaxID=5661 RepID=A0A504XM37_LEIDO|nr:hypothetical protein CGC21_29690 [Leishmania donovani]